MKDIPNGTNGVSKPATSQFEIEDRSYGHEFIKIVEVERNGEDNGWEAQNST